MKSFLISLMILATMALSAQTERGRFMISGQTALDFSYLSDDTKNVRSTGGTIGQESYILNISPAVGYFVADNFAILLQGEYIKEDSDYENKMSQFSIIPSLSYYMPTNGPLRPFVMAGIGYANVTQYLPYNNTTARHSFSGYTWSGGLGLAYFINNWISLSLSLQYSDINTSYSGDTSLKIKARGLGAGVGFSLFFN